GSFNLHICARAYRQTKFCVCRSSSFSGRPRQGAIADRPPWKSSFLLPLLLLYLLLDFLLDRFQVERSGRLHWRVVDRCLGELGDVLLHHHESPELASEKILSITKNAIVRRFATDVRRPFERGLSDVY